MITVEQYLMGRDKTHALSDERSANAEETVRRVNSLLLLADAVGVSPATVNGTQVASGWRPEGVNEKTSNAATKSNHITAKACDLHDDPEERGFARWCLRNQEALDDIGLWMENPMWTPKWVHLQTVPPKSGRRVYVPSENPPLAVALPEQQYGYVPA